MRLRIAVGAAALLAIALVAPEQRRVPVQGAAPRDWNAASFWHEPWGRSGVHKGVDVFAPRGTPVVAPTYGVVVFTGEIPTGGRVVLLLGPKLRLHYLAHLDRIDVAPGTPVRTGRTLGSVGDTGNARGKPPHLHYTVLSLVPYPWRIDGSTQGWKKAVYLDPLAGVTVD